MSTIIFCSRFILSLSSVHDNRMREKRGGCKGVGKISRAQMLVVLEREDFFEKKRRINVENILFFVFLFFIFT